MDELKALVNTYRVTVQGHSDYRIFGTLRYPIHLFRATEKTPGSDGIEFEDGREYWGWDEWTQAGVIQHWVPGTHVTMMASPLVQTLAATINEMLQE